MARKKILFLIVEGPSDETAIGGMIQRFVKDNLKVETIRGDITFKDPDNIMRPENQNVISCISNRIREYLNNSHFKKSDIAMIVHLIDMDGCYIDNSLIQYDPTIDNTLYSTSNIITHDVDFIIYRNSVKRAKLNRLSSIDKIMDIPYSCYFMSKDLDHVLFDNMNFSDDEKETDSYHFYDYYNTRKPGFLDFICNSDFSLKKPYKESWDFLTLPTAKAGGFLDQRPLPSRERSYMISQSVSVWVCPTLP